MKRSLLRLKRHILRWGTLVVSIVTFAVVVKAYYLAWDAYDVAIRQLKNQGSWVVVTLDEFKFGRSENRKGRTLGFFTVSIRNTLPADVKITDVDWRVPPQDWNKDWIFKELGKPNIEMKKTEKPSAIHAPTIRIGDDQPKTLPQMLKCCEPMRLKKMRVDVATDPVNEYCEKGQDSLEFWVGVSLEDDDKVPYKFLQGFRAYCVKSEKETIFRWNRIE